MKDKEEIKKLKGDGRSGYRKGMVNLRHMNPEKHEGPRGAVSFRQWSQDVKELASRYSVNLNAAMTGPENSMERIRKEKVALLGVDDG